MGANYAAEANGEILAFAMVETAQAMENIDAIDLPALNARGIALTIVGDVNSVSVAAAGLDVFSVEPPSPENPLFSFDQVVLSPHIAGLTAECAERMAIASVQNVFDFFEGRIDSGLVVNGSTVAAAKCAS
ncbi:MAG: NAD(P)-dependent oxidoreductase [Paracoccaceae bacterium]